MSDQFHANVFNYRQSHAAHAKQEHDLLNDIHTTWVSAFFLAALFLYSVGRTRTLVAALICLVVMNGFLVRAAALLRRAYAQFLIQDKLAANSLGIDPPPLIPDSNSRRNVLIGNLLGLLGSVALFLLIAQELRNLGQNQGALMMLLYTAYVIGIVSYIWAEGDKPTFHREEKESKHSDPPSR